ncbi:unnamed protein product [Brassica napus]|uniref:(rape) hypothetical protein n=1 Tax=Brassica napus TaxID=3708 RepID=A0A816YLL1_BRANA|nr:unnamed protein product [Brassica napus]
MANFKELNSIPTRKNQIVIITSIISRNISLLKENYYSPQHQEHVSASTLTTTLIS